MTVSLLRAGAGSQARLEAAHKRYCSLMAAKRYRSSTRPFACLSASGRH